MQNIDLMNLAGFCRNCLSKWYRTGAEKQGLEMSYDDACEIVYGMTYSEWKSRRRAEATREQLAAFGEAEERS